MTQGIYEILSNEKIALNVSSIVCIYYPHRTALRAESFVYSVYVEEFWQPYRVLLNKTRAL